MYTTAQCLCVHAFTCNFHVFWISQMWQHLTTVRMICLRRVRSMVTRRRWTPCRSTTACCTHAQETELSEPLTSWWVMVKQPLGPKRDNYILSVSSTPDRTCPCHICHRAVNVLVCLRVTAPKWAACWCLRPPPCIIVFILVPVTRRSAATVSR